MKSISVKMAVLTLMVSVDASASDQITLESTHKTSTRSFYSIIEKSSSTSQGIDTEVFEQASEAITNKQKLKNPADLTPQTISPLSPKQNQWLNNQRGHGTYFDDTVVETATSPLGEYHPVVVSNKEVLAVRAQMNKAAYDMNSTPYFKSPHQTEDAKMKQQLANVSSMIKQEEKRGRHERDVMTKELEKTAKQINVASPSGLGDVSQQLAASSRLMGYQQVTPQENMTKQLFISSKAMQRQNTFYPDQMGSTDMRKLVASSHSLDDGKRKTLSEVLNDIFNITPKSQPAPKKL